MADQDVDDSAEYLLDGSLYRDVLPQPYRLIEKILNNIIDNAWEIMTKLAAEQQRQALRYRALQYECCQPLEEPQCVNCLAVSCDNRYVFVGQVSGVTVVDGMSKETKAIWCDEAAHISSIAVATFATSAYMITTVDNKGVVHLLMFVRDSQLFVMSKLNQSSEETLDNRNTFCVSSHQAHFTAIYTINEADGTGSIYVFKLPKDAWTKELETILGGPLDMPEPIEKNASVEPEANPEKSILPEKSIHPSKSTPPSKPTLPSKSTPPGKLSDKEKTNAPIDVPKPADFTLPTAILTVNQPQARKGCTWFSPSSSLKAIDTSVEFLAGTGSSHIVTTNHLDMRRNMFARMRNLQPISRMIYMREDSEEETSPVTTTEPADIRIPTFHFLVPFTSSDQSIGSEDNCSLPPALSVWWCGERHVFTYVLTKGTAATSNKGVVAAVAEREPDNSWPMSSTIITSAQSACSMVLALALANNSIVVWNRTSGSFSSLKVEDAGQIVKLSFVNSASCMSDIGLVGHAHCLLVQSYGGRLYLVQAAAESWASLVMDEIECESEITTLLQPMPCYPKLALMYRQNGAVVIHDTCTSLPLFEVVLPSTHSLYAPPPMSVVAVTNTCTQLLYIIGATERVASVQSAPDEGTAEPAKEPMTSSVTVTERSLFVFDMASLLPLPDILSCCLQLTANESQGSDNYSIVDKALYCRLVHQEERKMRLHENWFKLKKYLTAS